MRLRGEEIKNTASQRQKNRELKEVKKLNYISVGWKMTTNERTMECLFYCVYLLGKIPKYFWQQYIYVYMFININATMPPSPSRFVPFHFIIIIIIFLFNMLFEHCYTVLHDVTFLMKTHAALNYFSILNLSNSRPLGRWDIFLEWRCFIFKKKKNTLQSVMDG